ncbi:hypothetical protein [Micromonospora fulviviridis]|uniref:Uncharacterized protein n=1 Tax=Micromonospora fulviviridis TaxID=47860 RepID=A0ABV2VV46_9ACTN
MLDDEAAAPAGTAPGLPVEDAAAAFSYTDLAVAVVDEIEHPKHARWSR